MSPTAVFKFIRRHGVQSPRYCSRAGSGSETKIADEMGKSALLNLSIPVSVEEAAAWNQVLTKRSEGALEQAMHQAINALDQIVGQCLGLNESDIVEIQRDLANDLFLKNIRPRYPGTITRKQGFGRAL